MITAVVLAAGLSTRMGLSKPMLPFGEVTVIEHLLSILKECLVDEILIVTGFEHTAIEKQLVNKSVNLVFNPNFNNGEMLDSIHAGLKSVSPETDAVLLVLADQPNLESSVVGMLVDAYRQGKGGVVVPSYQMRRGHPFLIARNHWKEILALEKGKNLRDFFKSVDDKIFYVTVLSSTVIIDMDTPDDYHRELDRYNNA